MDRFGQPFCEKICCLLRRQAEKLLLSPFPFSLPIPGPVGGENTGGLSGEGHHRRMTKISLRKPESRRMT
jgi:hypothetical protein